MNVGYALRKSRLGIPRLFGPGSQVSEIALLTILSLAIGFGAVAGRQASVARLAVGALGGILFFLISISGRLTAVRLSIVWLIFMGLVRRLLIPFAGWSEQDPLLLVGPACAVMIWMNGRKESPATKVDFLTFGAVILLFTATAQIFNPLQDTILDGAYGAIFWIPPILWFFAGRTLNIANHKKLMNLIIVLAIPVAVHGLYQTYFGFLPFELTWIGVSSFGEAIFYEGFKIRSFSTLTSPQEYGQLLAFAAVTLYSTILAGHGRKIWRSILLLFLLWAMFLQGSRGIFGFFIVSMVVITIVRTRNLGIKLSLVSVVSIALILGQSVQPPQVVEGGTGHIIRHQLHGLLNPTSQEGTGPLHFLLITRGFQRSIENPMGLGTSPATIVQIKKGETETASTENDVSTVFVSFGIPAGIFFLFFVFYLYFRAVRRYRITRSAYALGVLGIFLAFVGQIWSGPSYAVSSFLWLTIGGLARPDDEELLEEEPRDLELPAS